MVQLSGSGFYNQQGRSISMSIHPTNSRYKMPTRLICLDESLDVDPNYDPSDFLKLPGHRQDNHDVGMVKQEIHQEMQHYDMQQEELQHQEYEQQEYQQQDYQQMDSTQMEVGFCFLIFFVLPDANTFKKKIVAHYRKSINNTNLNINNIINSSKIYMNTNNRMTWYITSDKT